MSDDDSDSDGSGGGMTPEEAAEAQKWMSSWRLEMEGALAGASRAQEVSEKKSTTLQSIISKLNEYMNLSSHNSYNQKHLWILDNRYLSEKVRGDGSLRLSLVAQNEFKL
jgi:hypothetical protein